jgi:hypothetical protein
MADRAPSMEFPNELFMTVTTELGDVILGPPGTRPAKVAKADGA